MNILVTGATGFLGGHLARALLHEGHSVWAHGRNVTVCQELARFGCDIFRADLEDARAMRAACAEMDAVFHVAALSEPWGAKRDFRRANVEGTRNVLAGCREHGVKRLIHVSSPSVNFNGQDQVNVDESVPCPRRFLSWYSWSKKLAEDLVREAHRKGLPTVILRPKAIFGPGDTTLLPKLLQAARAGKLPQIGTGDNLVDLTHVENVVHALLLALDAPRAVGKTYLITGGEHIRLWDLIRMILKRFGIPDRLRVLPYRLVYALAMMMEWRAKIFGGEPTLTRYTAAILARTQTYDISAARRDLGYEPVTSVAEGVEQTLASLREMVHA